MNTEQIVPKQFLKLIRRTGFALSLFHEWRYGPDGLPDPNFELNRPRFENASILVVRHNFGCGSGRQQAAWAILENGYRVVVGSLAEVAGERVPAFSDFFRSNATVSGLLTVDLRATEIDRIFEAVATHDGLEATVELESQTLILHTPDEEVFRFEIDSVTKDRLLRGLDDVALSLEHEADIAAFEATRYDPLAAGGSEPAI